MSTSSSRSRAGRSAGPCQLSADLNAEGARATYEDGILRIELPLVAESSRPHTVPIERTDQD